MKQTRSAIVEQSHRADRHPPLPAAGRRPSADGPLFDRFVQYRHVVVAGLSRYGEEAMRLHPPAAGARVLDVGCGFGDITRELAARVGAGGSVLGVDASPRFIAAARRETLESSTPNVRFEVADVETSVFSEQFDLASRASARSSREPWSPRSVTSAGRWCPVGGW